MRPTILSIDDEPDVLELIRFQLTRAGCEVITATSGRSALETIRGRRPDLILLDLMLPDIDGFGFCEILHREPETAAIPILIVSAWSTSDSRHLGLELGALDYLTKPFSPRALVERVRRFLPVLALPAESTAPEAAPAAARFAHTSAGSSASTVGSPAGRGNARTKLVKSINSKRPS